MAAYKKHNNAAVYGILKHNNRETQKPSNVDIDPQRTKLNYNLTPPDRGNTLAENKEYYNKRLDEVYHYKRDTLVTCCEWVITAPKELPQSEEKAFFAACYNFFNEQYGEKNVIHCSVHHDEGIKNDQGTVVYGKPHMHYMFIPVVSCEEKHGFVEKVCCKERMTRNHLLNVHPQLNEYLAKSGVHCDVNSGITGGKNRTVRDMKAQTLRDMIMERDRNIEALKSENYQLRNEVEMLRGKTRQLEAQKNISTRRRFGEIEREEEYEY